MKLSTYTLLLLSLLLTVLWGCRIEEEETFAPEEVFTRIYNNSSFDNFEALDFVQTEDNGYLILARYYNQEEDFPDQPYLLRVDSKGNFLWDTYRDERAANLGTPFGKLFETPAGYSFFTHVETNGQVDVDLFNPRVRDVKVGQVSLVSLSDVAGGNLSAQPLPYTKVRPMGMSLGRNESVYLHLWVSNVLEQKALQGEISKDNLPTDEDYPTEEDYPDPNDYPTIDDFDALGCNEITILDSLSFIDSVLSVYPKPANYPTEEDFQAIADAIEDANNDPNLTQEEYDAIIDSLQQEENDLIALQDSIDQEIAQIAAEQYEEYIAELNALQDACDDILFQLSRFQEITDSLDNVIDSLNFVSSNYQNRVDSLNQLSAHYFIKLNTQGATLSEFEEYVENSLVSPAANSLFIEPFETASAPSVEAVTMLYDGEERYWAFLDFEGQRIVAEGYPYDDPIGTTTLHFKQARESGLCGTIVTNGNDLFTHTNLGIEISGETASFTSGSSELGTFHELQNDLESVKWNSQTLDNERFFVILATDHTTRINIMAFRPESRFSGGRIVLGEVAPYEPAMLRPTTDGGIAVLGTTYVAGRFRRIVLFKLEGEKVDFLKGN